MVSLMLLFHLFARLPLTEVHVTKVQMKLYISQSFVLHVYCHFSIFGAFIAASFTTAIAPCYENT